MIGESIAPKRDNILSVIDYICAALLALCPLLQHYVGPLYNAGISALVFIAVYLIIRMFQELPSIKPANFSFVLIMVVYQTYRIINHGTTLTEFGQSGVFIVFMLALALGKINIEFMLKVGRLICLVASVCLFLQYFFFYIFEIHLQMVLTSLLIPAAEQWILGAMTGLAGVTGRIGNFYRPSAFFLEPAHVYLYMFPHLILLLFDGKLDRKALWMALLISCGIFLSTSGMGIGAVMGIWALFLVTRNEKDGTFSLKNIFRKRNLIVIGIMAVVFILAVIYVPFVGRAVRRVFIPGKTGSTAITGRISNALGLVSTMTPFQWFFGVADNTHGILFHIPGVLDVLYRHGLIGFVLSYELYVKCICKLSFPYKFIGVVVLITSLFSAHTHSTIGMLYFLLILMNGFQNFSPPQPGVQPYVTPDPQNKINLFFAKILRHR